MYDYAARFFALGQPAAKGAKITKRESLEQVQKAKRKKDPSFTHPELKLPELPEAVSYIWKWYMEELQTGDVISWREIEAWAKLTGKEIRPMEACAIRKLANLQFSAHTPAND